MVAGSGHGCIVLSIPEPHQGHSLPKLGLLPSYFSVKQPWLLFITSNVWTVMAKLLHLCILSWHWWMQYSTLAVRRWRPLLQSCLKNVLPLVQNDNYSEPKLVCRQLFSNVYEDIESVYTFFQFLSQQISK